MRDTLPHWHAPAMHDPAPEVPRADDSSPEPGPTAPPVHSGLTRFLVEDPSAAGISRETLVEAVRSLLRERDYLRQVRELALADFELDKKLQREHTEELEALQLREARAHQAQADELREKLRELETQVEAHQAQSTELKAALSAYEQEVETLMREREELLADRDAWQKKATRSLPSRVMRTLRGWVKRSPRSS